MSPDDRWGGRLGRVIFGGSVAAAVVTLRLRDPNVPGSYGVCPSIAVFGVLCPLCGGLRATHALASGHWAEAWMRNPLLVLGVALAAAAVVAGMAARMTGRPQPALPAGARRPLGVTLAVLLVAFTVVRNPPFLLLQPL